MFVVEIGAVITTGGWLIQVFGGPPLGGGTEPAWFTFTVSIWLWLTVVFANLAESIAEGRGRAQAATLRSMRQETVAHLKEGRDVSATELRRGDVVVVAAGELIPGDGTVIEGIASVDESAITGESAPVIRESGGDRSAVTGGTRVLSDRIVVEITQEPGKSFLDRMISLVEGAERRKTPNEIALNILLAGLTIVFLVAVVTPASVRRVRGHRGIGRDPDRAAGVADPDDDRRAAVGDRHRRHGSHGAPQRAGAVGARRRGVGRRRRAAARQDRHDHAWQPGGRRASSRCRESASTSWPRRRSWRRSPTRPRRVARSSCSPSSTASASASCASHDAHFVPFTAETRMSGVDINGNRLRKGAGDAIHELGRRRGWQGARASCSRSSTASVARAARRWRSRETARCWASSI